MIIPFGPSLGFSQFVTLSPGLAQAMRGKLCLERFIICLHTFYSQKGKAKTKQSKIAYWWSDFLPDSSPVRVKFPSSLWTVRRARTALLRGEAVRGPNLSTLSSLSTAGIEQGSPQEAGARTFQRNPTD